MSNSKRNKLTFLSEAKSVSPCMPKALELSTAKGTKLKRKELL